MLYVVTTYRAGWRWRCVRQMQTQVKGRVSKSWMSTKPGYGGVIEDFSVRYPQVSLQVVESKMNDIRAVKIPMTPKGV